MKTVRVHDKAIVVIFSRKEAEALRKRLELSTGVIKSKVYLKSVDKLDEALEETQSC